MEYLEITADDINRIAALAERHLTHGSIIIEDICQHAADGDYFGIKAMEGFILAGFYTYVDDTVAFTVPHPELEDELRKRFSDGRIITGDAIYVAPEFQQRGIGQELSRRVSALARSLGGRYFITEAWIQPDGSIPSRKAFLCNGEVLFEKTIPLFYQGMDKLGMECPVCGKNCICGAQIQMHRL